VLVVALRSLRDFDGATPPSVRESRSREAASSPPHPLCAGRVNVAARSREPTAPDARVDSTRSNGVRLLDRDAAGDRAAARSLLDETAEQYARFGMRRHRELTERLLAGCAA